MSLTGSLPCLLCLSVCVFLFFYFFSEQMSQQKRISAGCRVAGLFGPLVPNPRGHKRRIRQKVYGTVVRAVDMGRWEVLFDFDEKK